MLAAWDTDQGSWFRVLNPDGTAVSEEVQDGFQGAQAAHAPRPGGGFLALTSNQLTTRTEVQAYDSAGAPEGARTVLSNKTGTPGLAWLSTNKFVAATPDGFVFLNEAGTPVSAVFSSETGRLTALAGGQFLVTHLVDPDNDVQTPNQITAQIYDWNG